MGTSVQPSGGEIIADVLERRGVRFLFTLCGGHISPILVGAKGRGIRVIDVRHEATAVFAADAVARLTGIPGVAAVTAGPGVTNTLTALKNAQLAQSPLVLLGGAVATLLKGRGALQDIEQLGLLRTCVKSLVSIRRVADLRPALEAAFDMAAHGVPGPVFVECPVDVLYPENVVRDWYQRGEGGGSSRGLASAVKHWYVNRHLDRLFAAGGRAAPRAATLAMPEIDDRHVRRAARLLASAERPLMLVGSQALLRPAAVAGLSRAVEALGIPIYQSGMGRGLLARDHRLTLRHGRGRALKEADLLILAGVPADFRLQYGAQIGRETRLISVNRDAATTRKNRRPTLGVAADPGLFVERLAASFKGGQDWSPWCDRLRERDRTRDAEIEGLADEAADKVNPLSLLRAIDRALPDDSVLVLDGGDFAATAAYVVAPRRPLSFLDPGVFGTLGVGAGFALGARLCRPEAEVWILYGDGSAAYSLAEFDTFVRHGIPVIAVVGNDAGWTQIARGQIEILGDDVGTVLRPTDYDRVAEGFGGVGIRVESASDVAAALARAAREARAGRPVLINALLAPSNFRAGSMSM